MKKWIPILVKRSTSPSIHIICTCPLAAFGGSTVYVLATILSFICLTYPVWALTWLWRARKETGESMASRDLAQRRTTFSPVLCIFSVSWSTAMLLGAHTRIWLYGWERERGREREGRREGGGGEGGKKGDRKRRSRKGGGKGGREGWKIEKGRREEQKRGSNN